jgi:hypothetical protein
MVENRFTRYLIYAIGEIFLVVIGILIAVQVNDWNNDRKLRKEEEAVLRSVISEFEENRQTLNESIDRAERRAGYCTSLLKHIGPDVPSISKDSADYLIQAGLYIHVTVELTDAYLRDLIATGKIHLIRNDSLRYFLANWEKYVFEVKEDESQLFEEKSRLLKPFLIEHYSMSNNWSQRRIGHRSKFEFDHREIFMQSAFEDLVIDKIFQYQLISHGYEDLQLKIEKILYHAKEGVTSLSE